METGAGAETVKTFSDIKDLATKNYGENGSKAYISNYNEDIPNDVYTKLFDTYYDSGNVGIPYEKVNTVWSTLVPDDSARAKIQYVAYHSGVNDAALSAKKTASTAKIKSSKGGIINLNKLLEVDTNHRMNDGDVSAIDALGKVLGIDIEFAEQVHGGKANGSHDKNGKITIAVDASNPFVTVLNHEITHDLQVKSPELYKKYRDYVVSELKAQDPELFEALFNHYASMYGYENGDISREGILDEIAADASEKFLQDEKAIKKLAKENRSLAERILSALRNIISKIKKAMEGLEPRTGAGVLLNKNLDIAKKAEKLWLEALSDVASNKGVNTTTKVKAKEAASVKDDVRYSLNPDFARQYDSWDKKSTGGYFKIGTVSDVLQGIDVKNANIYWDKSKIIKIKKHHPEMTDGIIKQVPNMLEDPIIVVQSLTVTNRIVLFGEIIADNRPVITALELTPYGRIANFVKIVSSYAKDNAQTLIDKSDILYVNPDKKRTNTWLEALRLQLPAGLTKYGSIGMVTYSSKDSKGEIEFKPKNSSDNISAIQIAFDKASDVTNSSIRKNETNDTDQNKLSLKDSAGRELAKEQAEYFKDSRVRDENGNLLVVYHGTENDFTVFDFEKGGSSLTENAMYFTKNKQKADAYGENGKTISAYLKIENPVYFGGNNPTQFDRDWVNGFNYFNDETFNFDELAKKTDYAVISLANHISKMVYNMAKSEAEVLRDYFGFDGTIDGEDYAVFSPNQIKSVDNLNPTSDPDIRCSLKDYEPIDFAALVKENKKLKEVNALLKEQFRITKGVRLDQKAVDKLANKIVKNYSSGYDPAVLSKQLNEMFTYIANGKEVNFDTAVDVGANIGRQVLEQTEVADTSYVDRYSELKRDIRNTRLYVPDNVKSDIGDYGDFIRSNFGRLRLVNDRSALHIDSYFKELSSEYPELFNEGETTVPSDQLLRIADVAASIKETMYRPFDEKVGGDIDTASTAFAYELFEEYFNVPQMKKTFADKKLAELNRANAQYKRKITEVKNEMKSKYEERLSTVKEQNATKIAELTKKAEKAQGELKDKYNARIEALRDHRNERLQAQALKYQEQRKNATKKRNESAAVRKYKNRIIKNVTELGNWLLKPTDKKHVSKGLEKLVTEFLGSIDFSSNRLNKYGEPTKRTQLWNKLKDRYNNILKSYSDISSSGKDPVGDYIEVDVDLIEKLQSLVDSTENVHLEDMTAEQLKTLSEVVAAVKKSITNANVALSDGKKQEISSVGEGFLADNKDRKVKASRGKAIDSITNMLNLHMLDTDTFFEKLGNTMRDFYRSTLRTGLDKKISCLQEATEYARPLLEGVKVNELSGKSAKIFSFEIESGQKIQMTTAQIMSLYCLNKREQAKGHIYKGGIRPSVIERITGKNNIISYDPVQVSEIDVGNILSVLTAEQKQLAEGLAKFFEVTSRWGNEVSRMLYGYDKFTESNYFPIVSDSNYTLKPEGQQVNSIETLKNLGMTKATVKGANNPIIVEDIFDVFTRQVDQMSSYNAFVIPVSDMQKLYNYKVYAGEGVYSESVKKTIEKVLGKGGKEYYLNLLNDINGNKMTGSVDGIFNRMLSNAKIAAVGANLRVIIQQPTAYVRALNELDPKYLVKGLAKKGDFEKVKKYAKIARWKDWGFFEINTGRQVNDIILGRENFGSKTLKAAGAADNITWAKLWNAVEYEIADKRPELEQGSEQFNEAVAERFSEVVDKTQVVDSVLHRSEIMRSGNTLVKMSTSFMSEPIKAYNMLYSALTNATQEKARTGKISEAMVKIVTRAALTHIITNAATAAASAIIDAFRDDDEDKWADKYGEAFKADLFDNINPLNMIPIARDVVSIFEGYDPSRLDMDGIADFSRVVMKSIDYSSGNSKNYKFSAILKDLVGSTSKLTGIPIKNIMRELEMIGDIILDGLEKAGMNTTSVDFAVLKSFYSPLNATGKTKYYDLLYKAKVNKNMRMYNEIQRFMLQAGVKESAVRNAVKNRGTKELLENELVIKAAKSKKAGKGWSLWMEKLVKEGYTTAQVNAAINALIEKDLV